MTIVVTVDKPDIVLTVTDALTSVVVVNNELDSVLTIE